MWKSGPTQFVPFIVTVVGIVGSDLLSGVAAGLWIIISFERGGIGAGIEEGSF